MIISFAWTSESLLQGKKTVTRRRWKKQWVKIGDLIKAYDKSPRFGGKQIATIKIICVTRERLSDIIKGDIEKEGGLWKNKEEFIQMFLEGNKGMTENDFVYRIEFEVKK